MNADVASAVEPFRGLRFFDEEHSDLFFGRDDQIDALLHKLAQSRFVAVLGGSGSGKSSLVRAGLIPALRAGLLVTAGGRWHVVKSRPADDPIGTLAQDIAAVANRGDMARDVEVSLRRGPLGVVEAIAQTFDPAPHTNVLLVIDQFEELFRYLDEAQGALAIRRADDAAAYVNALLEATKPAHDTPGAAVIYVVLTMRSDFLSRCSQFPDLSDQFNTAIYLVPRMRRKQLEQAMRGPVAVVDGTIDAALVQQVLNDVGDDLDQLPVLEHALLMTWRRTGGNMQLDDYKLAGALTDALSQDANRVFKGLSPRQQRIAKVMFQRLSSRDAENRAVRRRAYVSELAQVAHVDKASLVEVIDKFEKAGLLTKVGAQDERNRGARDEPLIDVPHESLIRKWDKFQTVAGEKGWLDEEADARDLFLELDTRARRRKDVTDVLTGTDLAQARVWTRAHHNEVWASRYIPDPGRFAAVRHYIADSLRAHRAAERQREREIQARIERERADAVRRRNFAIGSAVLAAIFAVLLAVVWSLYGQQSAALESARRARDEAAQSLLKEQAARKESSEAQAAADRAKLQADRNAEVAEMQRAEAQRLAESEMRAAEAARQAQSEAIQLKGEAEKNAATAEDNRKKAEAAQAQAQQERDAARQARDVATTSQQAALKARAAEMQLRHTSLVQTAARAAIDGPNRMVMPPPVGAAPAGILQRLQQSVIQQFRRSDDPDVERAVTAEFAVLSYLLHNDPCKVSDERAGSYNDALLLDHLKPCPSGQVDANVLRALQMALDGYQPATFIRVENGTPLGVIEPRTSSDPRRVVALAGNRARLVEPRATGAPYAWTVASDRRTTVTAVSPDGFVVAVGTLDGEVVITPGPGTPRQWLSSLKISTSAVSALAFSPDSSILAAATTDGLLRSVIGGSQGGSAQLTDAAIVRTIAFEPSGKAVVLGTNKGLRRWNFTPTVTTVIDRLDVRAVGFSPDGSRIVFGTDKGDVRVALWNGSTLQSTVSLAAAAPAVTSVALSSDDRRLAAAAGSDGSLRVWRVAAPSTSATSVPPTVTLAGVPTPIRGLTFTGDRRLSFIAPDGARTWTISMRRLADDICQAVEASKLTPAQLRAVRDDVQRVVGDHPLQACSELKTATPDANDPAR
jgi:DNA-binding MarR family transcriptional regulator